LAAAQAALTQENVAPKLESPEQLDTKPAEQVFHIVMIKRGHFWCPHNKAVRIGGIFFGKMELQISKKYADL